MLTSVGAASPPAFIFLGQPLSMGRGGQAGGCALCAMRYIYEALCKLLVENRAEAGAKMKKLRMRTDAHVLSHEEELRAVAKLGLRGGQLTVIDVSKRAVAAHRPCF